MPISPAQFIREHVLEMSQVDLAAELGISQGRISKIESEPDGKYPERHREKIGELAEQRGKTIPVEWWETLPLAGGQS